MKYKQTRWKKKYRSREMKREKQEKKKTELSIIIKSYNRVFTSRLSSWISKRSNAGGSYKRRVITKTSRERARVCANIISLENLKLKILKTSRSMSSARNYFNLIMALQSSSMQGRMIESIKRSKIL